MRRRIVLAAALLVAIPSLADAQRARTTVIPDKPGASEFAPGQQAKRTRLPAKTFAPGQQAKKTGKAAKTFAPGQR